MTNDIPSMSTVPKKHRVWPVLRLLLDLWGAVSLIGALILTGLICYGAFWRNRPRSDTVTPHDVRFVASWCGVGEDRVERVVHSYISDRSFTGDHLDAYAIKLSHLTAEELMDAKPPFGDGWYRGDELPDILDKAVKFVGGYRDWEQIRWLPKEPELRSHDIFVHIQSANFHGLRPTAVELVFARPADGMLFYIGGKT